MPNTSVKIKTRLTAFFLALALGAGLLPGFAPALAWQTAGGASVQSASASAAPSPDPLSPSASATGESAASSEPQPGAGQTAPESGSASASQSAPAAESASTSQSAAQSQSSAGDPASSASSAAPSSSFVLDQTQNESLPTLFAAAPTAAVQTWMDIGGALPQDQWPKGAGTQASPYLIASAEQLGWFSYQVNVQKRSDLCAELITDINLAGNYWFPIGANVIGAGINYAVYTGHFNGRGYYVNNLTIDLGAQGHLNYNANDPSLTNDALGLFGCISTGGLVEQVMMRDVSISNHPTSSYWACMGGVAGEIWEGGKISRCGLVSGLFTAQGACYWAAAGGIVGDAHSGATITDCFSRMTIARTGTSTSEHGIQLGGLLGRVWGVTTVKSCYVASRFSGPESVNPIYGVLGQGSISCTSVSYEQRSQYQNTQNIAGVTVLPEGTMAKNQEFLNRLNAPYGSSPVWFADRRELNDGYPLPAYQNDPSWYEKGMQADTAGQRPAGSGTAASPYQIGTATQLAWFMYKVNSDNSRYGAAHVQLTADIDLSGQAEGFTKPTDPAYMWRPIGQGFEETRGASYRGVFDGQGHTIKNLRLAYDRPLYYDMSSKGDSTLGLFGYLNGATVKNLLLDSVLISSPTSGSYRYLWCGGVAAVAENSVLQNCGVQRGVFTASGAVSWEYWLVGGLVADTLNSKTFTLNNCFAQLDATSFLAPASNKAMGGLVGRAYNGTLTLQNSYAAGSLVTGTGLVHQIFNNIVVTAANNYYQSTLPADSRGASKTLAQLQSADFLQALNAGQEPRVWYAPAPYGLDNQSMPVPLGYYGSWHGIGRLAAAGSLPGYTAYTGGGTAADPYAISTPEQMACLAYQMNTNNAAYRAKAFRLQNDLDLTGAVYGGTAACPVPWAPIGYGFDASHDSYFSGVMDGGGRTISGMAAYASQNDRRKDGTYDLGFFGWANGAQIKNVLFANSRAVLDLPAASYFSAGILAGRTANASLTGCGILSSCQVQMPAKGGNWYYSMAGGLIGDVHAGTTRLTACFSRAQVQHAISVSNPCAGVLVGRIWATLQANGCYAAGTLQGAGYALAQPGKTSLQNVYADTQLTGKPVGVGAALTTQQMKSLAALENLNKGLKDSANNPCEAFVFDAANENEGYPVLIFGNTAAGETFFTTQRATLTVAPSLTPGEALLPANVTGTGSATVKADSTLTAVFDLSSYMPHVPAGKDSPDSTANPYPVLQSAVLDLGTGGLPKGAAIVLAYRTGGKTGDVYNRAYAKYTAPARVQNGQVPLTDFTLVPSGGGLALADLLKVAKQQLVVYVDYTGVAEADNQTHTGEVRLICTGGGDTQVLAGSHDLTAPAKMPGLNAGEPAAPGAYSLAFSSTPAGEGGSFKQGDLTLTVTYSGGSQSADNAKGLALGAVVCLKDDNGVTQSIADLRFSTDGGTSWVAPSNAAYTIVPASGQAFHVRGLTDAQLTQLTAQLYASSTQIDDTLPRGAYLVKEAVAGSSSVAADQYALRAEAPAGDTRVFEVNPAGNSVSVLLTAKPDPLPAGCTLGVQLLKKQPNGDYAQAGGLLTLNGDLKPGQNTLTLAGSATAGTYRLLFTLYDPSSAAMASVPYNLLLRAEA